MTAPFSPSHSGTHEPRGWTARSSCALGFAIGAGVLGAFAAVEPVRPLPALPWAAAFLFCVAWQDVWRSRIPNALTLPALLGAWTYAAVTGGLPGLCHSLAGTALAFALLFAPFAARVMGAGDVKAAMVIGGFWGSLAALHVLIWSVFLAGAAALILLAARGGLGELGRRWNCSVGLSLALRRPMYLAPAPGSAAASGLPFGAALGFGAVLYCAFGAPWAA